MNDLPLSEQPINVYIGLGSNLENPLQQLRTAIASLRTIPKTQFLKLSNIYQSVPVGPVDQPNYSNCVALLETSLAPEVLLDKLQNIEFQQGRIREVRWSARTLDLDIILYANSMLHTARLTVPHAEMENRNFVLIPLMDIAPELIFPNGKSLRSVTNSVGCEGIKQIISNDDFMKID